MTRLDKEILGNLNSRGIFRGGAEYAGVAERLFQENKIDAKPIIEKPSGDVLIFGKITESGREQLDQPD